MSDDIQGMEVAIEAPAVETVVETEHTEAPKPKAEDDEVVPKGVQKRIDRAVRRQYEAEAEAKVLREWKQQQEARPAPQPQESTEPKLENYQSYDDFIAAKAEHIAERKVKETLASYSQQQAMERAQAARRQTVDTWQQKVTQATADLPDFADVVGSSSVPMPEHMQAVIMQSDQGPKLAYYLAEHPDEAEQIASQHPLAAIRALMRIEDKLIAPKAKPTTDAPAPISPVGSTTKSEKDPSSMNSTEFANWRRKFISQRR